MKTYPKQNTNFAYDPARYTLPETTGEFNATEEFLRRRIFEYLVDKDETYVFDIWVKVFGNNPNTAPSRKVSVLVGRILRSLNWKPAANTARNGKCVQLFKRVNGDYNGDIYHDYKGDIHRIAENMGYQWKTNKNREEPQSPQNLKVLKLKRDVPAAAQPAADVTKLAAELLRAAAALLEIQTTAESLRPDTAIEQNKKIL